jgi:Arm DNA-binding domain
MPRTLNRLSPLRVQKLKRRGLHADGGGLYLRVTDGGTKSWMFRYGDGGKLRDMGLGPVHTISLPRARELARDTPSSVVRRHRSDSAPEGRAGRHEGI